MQLCMQWHLQVFLSRLEGLPDRAIGALRHLAVSVSAGVGDYTSQMRSGRAAVLECGIG